MRLEMDEIYALRRELHKRAELSLFETETKRYLMQWLSEKNTENRMQFYDMGAWFYVFVPAGTEKKRESIAFRGDMDALPIPDIPELPYASFTPGVSHRCGHDGHSANLAAACEEIADMNLDRDVYFIFQHAEEIGAGGEPCSRLIREKKIASVYAFHNWSGYPADTIIVKSGITHCASMGITFTFTGKTSHASQPEDGINPSASISQLILYAAELEKDPVFTARVMATIVHVTVGSKNFGINAGEGAVSMTLRGFKESEMFLLEKLLREKADELSREAGLTLSVDTQDIFPETVNDEASFRKVLQAAEDLGFQTMIMEDPIRSSEDFGYFQKACPGAMFYIGNGMDYPAVHTLPYDYRDKNFTYTIPMFCRLAEIG